jgi:hypothetical protein
MKTKFTSIAFVLSLFLLSCGSSSDNPDSSSNSKWTEEEKANFLRPCILNAEMNASRSAAENYCNCALNVLMNKYATAAEADAAYLKMTPEDLMQLTASCR